MITVETKPKRYSAVQWNGPGDGHGLVKHAPIPGKQDRYTVASMSHGDQPVNPGDWIVIGIDGKLSPRVYARDAFHYAFNIVEDGGQG